MMSMSLGSTQLMRKLTDTFDGRGLDEKGGLAEVP
jgi:hypothetical protein